MQTRKIVIVLFMVVSSLILTSCTKEALFRVLGKCVSAAARPIRHKRKAIVETIDKGAAKFSGAVEKTLEPKTK